jgi:hypothetical protein
MRSYFLYWRVYHPDSVWINTYAVNTMTKLALFLFLKPYPDPFRTNSSRNVHLFCRIIPLTSIFHCGTESPSIAASAMMIFLILFQNPPTGLGRSFLPRSIAYTVEALLTTRNVLVASSV